MLELAKSLSRQVFQANVAEDGNANAARSAYDGSMGCHLVMRPRQQQEPCVTQLSAPVPVCLR